MVDQWIRSRRRWLGTCAGVVGATTLAGCFGSDDAETGGDDESDDSTGGSDWPMYGVDLQNTAHHPDATGPDGNEVTERAILDLDGYSPMTTAIVDGTVYVSSTSGKMHAVSPDSEELLWSEAGYGPPTVHDGRVYGPTDDGRIFGYDAETGDRWESQEITSYSGIGLGRPIPIDGEILIESRETVWKIDPDSGEYTAVIDVPLRGRGSSSWPAIHDDTLYTARSSELHAVDIERRQIEWTFESPNESIIVDSNPAVAYGKVYIASHDQQLHAIDTGSGDEVWSIETEVRVETSPVVAGEMVYLGDHGRIIAVTAENGDLEWEADEEISREPKGVTVVDDVCYVVTRGGIWAYDAGSGELDWSYEIPIESDISFNAPPTISEGTIYVPSSDKTLYAIEDM